MNPPQTSDNPDTHVGRVSPVHGLAVCYECSLFDEDGEDLLVVWPCGPARKARRRRKGASLGVPAWA